MSAELLAVVVASVVVGTLLLHGLTLPWLIRRLGVTKGDSQADALAIVAARTKAANAAEAKLAEVLAKARQSGQPGGDVYEHAAKLLRSTAGETSGLGDQPKSSEKDRIAVTIAVNTRCAATRSASGRPASAAWLCCANGVKKAPATARPWSA